VNIHGNQKGSGKKGEENHQKEITKESNGFKFDP